MVSHTSVYMAVCACLIVIVSSKSEGQSRKNLITQSIKTIVKVLVKKDIPKIFPGTKWCGVGNTADHEDDYGVFEETDRCCKAHDSCLCLILTKSELFGLENDSPYTRLHCKCDYQFHDCLKRARKEPHVSNIVGYMYFNLLDTKCFQEVNKNEVDEDNEDDCDDSPTCKDDSTYDWFKVPPYLVHQNIEDEVSESVTNLLDDNAR